MGSKVMWVGHSCPTLLPLTLDLTLCRNKARPESTSTPKPTASDKSVRPTLVHADERLHRFRHVANVTSRNSQVIQFANAFLTIVFGDRNEQSAGGLGIEEKSLQIVGNFRFVADQAFCKFTIRFQPARNVP